MTKRLFVSTNHPREVLDITALINREIAAAEFAGGACKLFLAHTTAGLTTADLDPGMADDLTEALWELVPKIGYSSHHNPEHAPSHILGALIGPSLGLIVQNGQLVLGTWQRVVLMEFDGPKQRNLWITLS